MKIAEIYRCVRRRVVAGATVLACAIPLIAGAQAPPPPPMKLLPPTPPLLVDLQLTATAVASGVQLAWISPDPANTGIAYDVLRASGGSSFATITPTRVSATLLVDEVAFLERVTLNYKVMVYWPNGGRGVTNPVSITLPVSGAFPARDPSARLSPIGDKISRCLTIADLQVKFDDQDPNGVVPGANVYLRGSMAAASPWPGGVTVTLRDNKTGQTFGPAPWNPGVEPFTGGKTVGSYEFYRWIGLVGDKAQLSFSLDVVAIDANCHRHTFSGTWANANGVLP